MRACPHPGCTGQVTETGFCDLTGLPVDDDVATEKTSGGKGGKGQQGGRSRPQQFDVSSGGDRLMDLPLVDVPDPALLVEPVQDRPASHVMRCGNPDCTELIGGVTAEGRCSCGTPYALQPQLTGDDVLADQYQVIGPIAHGGLGWVYLAKDTQLHNRPVALKGLRNPHSEVAREVALRERRHLTDLNHKDIIRVINYATHRPSGTDYIVMEFAGGMALHQIAERIARDEEPFAGMRVHEFVVSYGIRILDALGYLHMHERKVYGDMKPDNVMHCGDGIKIIDVGGVREFGAPGPYTDHYKGPEVERDGRAYPQSDLYSVGKTLQELSDAARHPAPGLGAESLRRALARATADEPRKRFATAAEMSLQLRGVIRELRSLRLGTETFEPSRLFEPASAALDGGLGQAPALDCWAYGIHRLPLNAARPAPDDVAAGLPVPKTDPDDPNAASLSRISYDAPALQQLLADWPPSAELHLLRCRLHLDLARRATGGSSGHRDDARAELGRARDLLGTMAEHDWRINWHAGLLHLADDRIADARKEFDTVYDALPGEYAPKLALGYCHERLGRPDRARLFYEAVWLRNHSMGSAAFGLARIHLAREERDKALAILEHVPKDSRHRTAARTAIVRILAGRRPPRGAPPPLESIVAALAQVVRLGEEEGLTDRHAILRLETHIREVVLDWVCASGPGGAQGRAERRLAQLSERIQDEHLTENRLRRRLEESYRSLSEQAGDARAHALLDLANGIRPLRWTHKEHTWLGAAQKMRDAWKAPQAQEQAPDQAREQGQAQEGTREGAQEQPWEPSPSK
ncbi:protein kinase [Streptomyces sp. ISL-98]|uniref:serine/threonine-protein kinase n=1 Tax=Streptomyces sp. ISL-98 TaxID=2819192 RepID=UPI001BECDC66|nr:serine/threonine-protein kinase [Streptomyces sp. ISL-98]MBT2505482.1 protein kinase [Streptomyces sp. ISL-98]